MPPSGPDHGRAYCSEARKSDMSGTTTSETSAVTVALTELAAREVRRFLKQENLSLENPSATGGCGCGTSFSA